MSLIRSIIFPMAVCRTMGLMGSTIRRLYRPRQLTRLALGVSPVAIRPNPPAAASLGWLPAVRDALVPVRAPARALVSTPKKMGVTSGVITRVYHARKLLF